MVLGIKEALVECATVCVKSEVILNVHLLACIQWRCLCRSPYQYHLLPQPWNSYKGVRALLPRHTLNLNDKFLQQGSDTRSPGHYAEQITIRGFFSQSLETYKCNYRLLRYPRNLRIGCANCLQVFFAKKALNQYLPSLTGHPPGHLAVHSSASCHSLWDISFFFLLKAAFWVQSKLVLSLSVG